jgi:hypothetical protein
MSAVRIAGLAVPSLCLALLVHERPAAAASWLTPGVSCDLAAVELAQARFRRLAALRRFNPEAVSMGTLRVASDVYVTLAEACYDQLYGPPGDTLDEGALRVGVSGAAQYSLSGTKWGLGSPFPSTGADANGPRRGAGSIVTYSFMASGIGGFTSANGDSAPPGTTTTAIWDLPTYSSCFLTEIEHAFTAWSSVANIQFLWVGDSGLPFNAPGATAHIRIAAHRIANLPTPGFLAHAFAPPPNGSSAAGDIHFDPEENWSCTPGPGAVDIGIVATHEVGHAIGLEHELRVPGRAAMMNAAYNPSVVTDLTGDDINGAENIYGSAVGNSPDLIVDFGPASGAYILDFGVGWSLLHAQSPEQIVTGDLDGNGRDDIIVDFGPGTGVYKRMNNLAWSAVHGFSPARMAVGDFDGNGLEDVVMNFSGLGLWQYMNNATFVNIHGSDSSVFAVGDVDNQGGDDLVVSFPGAGLYRRMNNATWVFMHPNDAAQLVVGDFNETIGSGDERDDIVVAFAGGLGMYLYPDLGAPILLHGATPVRIAGGDMNRDGRDELVVDFGVSAGIWVYNHFVGWSQLHGLPSEDLALGDLDGNGQADVIVDFGPAYGIYVFFDNSNWFQMHSFDSEGLAVGDLN